MHSIEGGFPCLEVLRLTALDPESTPCYVSDVNPSMVIDPECAFPRVKELDLHGQHPWEELFQVIGDDLRCLSISPVTSMALGLLPIKFRNKFSKLEKLRLSKQDMEECRFILPLLNNATVEIIGNRPDD